MTTYLVSYYIFPHPSNGREFGGFNTQLIRIPDIMDTEEYSIITQLDKIKDQLPQYVSIINIINLNREL